MKTIFLTIGFLIPAVVIYFFIIGYASKPKSAIGLVSGKLAACSSKPNCVCSEQDDKSKIDKNDSHYIQPISIKSPVVESGLKKIIIEMGGEIIVEQDAYIAATFTSRFFGFVDDFELRIDQENNLIHVRSASRVGHSDFSVNRKRVEKFRMAVEEAGL